VVSPARCKGGCSLKIGYFVSSFLGAVQIPGEGPFQDNLVQALRDITTGGAVLPPHIASKLMHTHSAPRTHFRERLPDELTVSELEEVELKNYGLPYEDSLSAISSVNPRTTTFLFAVALPVLGLLTSTH
jgi:hypothetical protein